VKCLPVILLGFLLTSLCGCASETADSKSPTDGKKTGNIAAEQDTNKPPSPPPQPPLDKRRYDGYSIAQWQTRIKNIEPDGPTGKAAVDGLIALIRDDDVPHSLRRRAAVTLGRIGRPAKKAVPVFIALLQQPVENTGGNETEIDTAYGSPTIQWSLKALQHLGPVAKPATEELIAIVDDAERPIMQRAAALEALARIGTADSRAVQAVVKMLTRRRDAGVSRHDHLLLRRLAADSIALIGPEAFVAVPSLVRTSRHYDAELRRTSVRALGAMGARGQQAVVPLAESLTKDDSFAVRDAAADALAQIGPPALPALKKLLTDDDPEVRARAALSLGKMGPPAKPALDDLDYALDDRDGWVRINAAEAIWKITGETAVAVSAFIEELKNPNRQIRMKAYRQFKKLGPKAKSAEFALKRLLDDERSYVRAAAAKALRAIQAGR